MKIPLSLKFNFKSIAILLTVLVFLTLFATAGQATYNIVSLDNGGNNFSAQLDAYQRNVVFVKISYQYVGLEGGTPVYKYLGNIYRYRPGSGVATITVPPSNADLRHPSIWGKRIVWQDSRNDPVNQNNWDIYLYDESTATPHVYQLTTSSAKQVEPDIFGDYVVWLDARVGGGNNYDVYFYDLSVDTDGDGIPNYKDGDRPNPDPALKRLTTTSSAYLSEPRVYGRRVVWSKGYGTNHQVYSYDLDSDTKTQLAAGINGKPRPSLYRDMVVWLENSGGDVYKYDFNSPGRTHVLTSSWPLTTPALWGDKFAVEADNGSSDWDVRLYNLSGGLLWEQSSGADTVFAKNPTLFGDPGAGTGLVAWAQDTLAPESYDNNIKAAGIGDSDTTAPNAPGGFSAADAGVGGALNLNWSHSSSPDTAGYKLYWGTSPGSYTNSIDVYDVKQYQLKGLTNGQTYYLAVKAYDTSGNLSSSYSNESSAAPSPNVPPETFISDPTGSTTLTASPTIISGSATDTVAVDAVEISIKRTADGYWWNGSTMVSGGQVWLSANITAGQHTQSAAWNYSWDTPYSNGDEYVIYARAKDDTPEYDPTPAQVTVVADNAAPYTSVSAAPASPDGANGWYVTTPTIELHRNETGTTYWQWDSSAKPFADSSTAATATVTGLSPGSHTLYYYAVDSAGNIESTKYKVYKIDTVTPVTNLSDNPSTPDGLGGWYVTTPTITLTPSETAATTYYSWDTTTSMSTYSTTLTPPAGRHTLYYYSVDPAGNTETTKQQAYKVDTVAPTTALNSNPPGPDGGNGWYNTTTPTITLTPDETATTYYNWDSTSSMSTYSSTLTAPAGEHTLYYYSVDPAGNTETTKQKTYKVDTAAPSTTLNSNPASPHGANGWYNTTTPTITLTPDSTATTYYNWDTTASMSTYSTTLTAPAGEHTLYYYSIDSADNTESVNNQLFKVDTVGPTDPTSFISPDSTGAWLNHNQITLNWSGDATDIISGVDGYSIDWDHSPTPSTTPTLNVNYGQTTTTSPTLADGNNWWAHLRTVDKAGNWTSTKNIGPFWVDAANPNAFTLSSPGNNSWQKSNSPNFTWNASSDSGSGLAKYQLWIDGNLSKDKISGTQAHPGSSLSEGSHTWFVRAVDNAGNSRDSNTYTVKVDTIAPNTFTLSSPGNNSWQKTNSPNFTWNPSGDSGSGLAKYQLWVDGNLSKDNISGTQAHPGSSLSDGSHTWFVRAVDNAGNSRDSNTYTVKIDTQAPTNPTGAVEVGGAQDNVEQNTVSNPNFTWSGAADSGSGVQGYYYYFGTNAGGTSGHWTTAAAYNPSAVGPGTYYLRVRVKDKAGNLSAWQTIFTFKYQAQAFTAGVGWKSAPGAWDASKNKVAAGDFNHDGFVDLVSFYNYPSERRVKAWVWLNDGSGHYSAPQMWWDSGPGQWDWGGIKMAVGDFDNNGRDDIAIFYGYAVQRQTRAFVFTAAANKFNNPVKWWDSGPNNWDWIGSHLQVGDYNGDHKTDLLVFYGYFAQRQARAFVFTAAANKFNNPSIWWDSGPNNWDIAGTKLASGDFNADGRDDILAFYGYFATHQTRAIVFQSVKNQNKFTSSFWWDSGPNNWDWGGTKLAVGKLDSNPGSDIAALYGYSGNRARVFVFSANPSAHKFNSSNIWWDSGPGNWNWGATTILSGNVSDGAALDELLSFYNYGGNTSGIRNFQ